MTEALPSTPRTSLSLAAATLSFIGAAVMCLMSHLEHTKSVRPSALLNFYLLFSVLFDVVQLRTLWRIQSLETVARLFSSALALKVVLLVLEAKEKGSMLIPPYHNASPEAKSGLYNRSLFWWLNPFLTTGFKRAIATEDLYSLDETLSSVSHRKVSKILAESRQKWTARVVLEHCSLPQGITPRSCHS